MWFCETKPRRTSFPDLKKSYDFDIFYYTIAVCDNKWEWTGKIYISVPISRNDIIEST